MTLTSMGCNAPVAREARNDRGFLPITFITGVFGQNFGVMVDHLTDSRSAFVLGSLLRVATVVGILVFFKRRKWI